VDTFQIVIAFSGALVWTTGVYFYAYFLGKREERWEGRNHR